MARPFTATDDDILNAASKVIARRGPDGFSIAEVAADVGLSRAAIILRFKSTHALKVTLLTRMVERFDRALQTLPQTPSGENVLHLAAFIGGYIHSRDNLSSFFSTYSANVQDPDLRALEIERGRLLRAAVSKVVPKAGIDHESAVTAFSAHLTGTIMAWLAAEDDSSRRYLVLRTRDWLSLAGIQFDQQIVDELLAAQPDPDKVKMGVHPRRRKKSTPASRRGSR